MTSKELLEETIETKAPHAYGRGRMLGGIALRALSMLALLTILCGLVYTLAVTGAANLLFPRQAQGSIIEVDGVAYGSELMGQQFTDDGHLWGRIMNVDVQTFSDENGNPVMYAAPSNLSPASEEFERLVAERVERLRAANPDATMESIPVDLVTCSGSGLDPHISPAAATYQIPRIAEARGMTTTEVREIVEACTEDRLWGIFGEPVVNVLKVNLMLDGILKP